MNNLIYLDNSSTTFPKPKEIHDFMYNFYQANGVNPGRSGSALALETEQIITNTRKLLSNFFHAKNYNRLVFTYNASDSLNMIINGLVEEEDHVITTELEHNSVLRPLYHKMLNSNVQIDYIPFDEKGFVIPDDFRKKMRTNTRLVIVNHGSNVIGTIQPLKEIGAICKESGVPFVIDTSQTAGIAPIDMEAQHIDILAFTGHKSLLGPTGIGGFYVSEGIEIKPTRYGGTGILSALRTHPEDYPYRHECGTLNIMGIAGLYAGQKWIEERGLENIYAHEMKLWRMLKQGLSEIDGITLYCADSEEMHLPVLSFSLNDVRAGDVGKALDRDYGITTRAGLHCAPLVHERLGTDKIGGTVRMSVGVFNEEEHIQKAIEAVREIAADTR